MLGNRPQAFVAYALAVDVGDILIHRMAHNLANSNKIPRVVADGLKRMSQRVELPMAANLDLVEQFSHFLGDGLSGPVFFQLPPIDRCSARLLAII